MKIKKLEFKNINSLAGEWTIDFESPDFANHSMFCIAGPTGSGKTSILDAICLALYGKTPRQGSITSGSNEVMTKGTLESYARVSFEHNHSVYTAEWKQARSKGMVLKTPAWSITGENGPIDLQDKKKYITEIIGLDFDQFTKSMLLAQGQFNKFLTCSDTDRAKILEKMAGEELHRKIAQSVATLYDEAVEHVNNTQTRLVDVQLLSAEERAQLLANIETGNARKSTLSADIEKFNDICKWYEQMHVLEGNLNTANETLNKAKLDKENFRESEVKLNRALEAQEIEATYTDYNGVKTSIEKLDGQLKEQQGKLPGAIADLESARQQTVTAQSNFDKQKASYDEGEKLWNEVTALDEKIVGARGAAATAKKAVDDIQNSISESNNKIQKADGEIQAANKRLETIGNYKEANQKDALIEGLLPLVSTKNREWKNRQTEIATVKQKVCNCDKSLKDFDKAQEDNKNNLASANEYLKANAVDADLVNLVPEMDSLARDAKKHHDEVLRLEQAIATSRNTVAGYVTALQQTQADINALKQQKEHIIAEDIPVVVDELRNHLKEGAECPVCGSKDHPSCQGHTKQVADGANSLNSFAEKLRGISKDLDEKQANYNAVDAKKTAEEKLIGENSEKREAAVASENQVLGSLNAKLQPWNKTATTEIAESIVDELKTASKNYQDTKSSADSLQKSVNSAEVERATLNGDLKNAQTELQKALDAASLLSQEIEQQLEPWFSNILMENVDALISELDGKKSAWSKALQEEVNQTNALNTASTNRKNAEESLAKSSEILATASRDCSEKESLLAGLVQQRQEKFGEKSVDEERQKAKNAREQAESALNNAKTNEQAKSDKKNAIDSAIETLTKNIGESKPRLENLHKAFQKALSSKNFRDIQEFLNARLPEAERKSLLETKTRIENVLSSSTGARENLTNQIADHQGRRNFEETEEAAKQTKEAKQTEFNKLNTDLGTWTQQKQNDDANRARNAGLQSQLDAEKNILAKWEQMQNWFNGKKNSVSGDKFVKFIQEITLRTLLKIANRHMHDLFPRYEMIVQPGSLDIFLVDHHNSDDIRPVSNISGGESFLVSLSLALGISTLAGRNISIDTMFLDEGFGTLDTKTLQETIVVLQKMQTERGKQLGIITHVDAVKDELPVHIDVVPQGGKSILSGAGVNPRN